MKQKQRKSSASATWIFLDGWPGGHSQCVFLALFIIPSVPSRLIPLEFHEFFPLEIHYTSSGRGGDRNPRWKLHNTKATVIKIPSQEWRPSSNLHVFSYFISMLTVFSLLVSANGPFSALGNSLRWLSYMARAQSLWSMPSWASARFKNSVSHCMCWNVCLPTSLRLAFSFWRWACIVIPPLHN